MNQAKHATASFLVELGTEELPPKALLRLSNAFGDGIAARLGEAELDFQALQKYATPRRLAVHISGLRTEQAARVVEHRGPPVDRAFDSEGEPTRAATAFAEKHGVTIDQLQRQKTPKGEWLFYSGEQTGKPATELLPTIVDAALAALPIPKRMRWGNNTVEFVRPVHWLVMLLDEQVITAEILGQKSGRVTYGHRFHAPDGIHLKHADDYPDILQKQGYVMPDFTERRAEILKLAATAAESLNGEAVLEPDVVDEVTALVEWPVPVVGQFDEKYLRLPSEVLMSTLQDHQKYFPLRKGNDLLPAFIAISNLNSKDPDQVRLGNERVVLPRLADAAFFWDQDTKQSLASREPALDAVVYQEGLGSLREKSTRVASLAADIAASLGTNEQDTKRAALLAKTDLLTDMVAEFPELQGRMGYYYALHDGEPDTVARAIEEQYLPRHAGDNLPGTPIGNALSLAERFDTLAGIFALDKKPTGNKDPFGLRRQALGIVRICINNRLDLDLKSLLQKALDLQPVKSPSADPESQLYDFILDRAQAWYTDGQAPDFGDEPPSMELFLAVRDRKPNSLVDLHERVCALNQFMQLDAADSLAAANKRIANILKSADVSSETKINVQLFAEDEERNLHGAVQEILSAHEQDLVTRNYASALGRLAELRTPVDKYFDKVMVMADDDDQRMNRLAQLVELRSLFLDIADISGLRTHN